MLAMNATPRFLSHLQRSLLLLGVLFSLGACDVPTGSNLEEDAVEIAEVQPNAMAALPNEGQASAPALKAAAMTASGGEAGDIVRKYTVDEVYITEHADLEAWIYGKAELRLFIEPLGFSTETVQVKKEQWEPFDQSFYIGVSDFAGGQISDARADEIGVEWLEGGTFDRSKAIRATYEWANPTSYTYTDVPVWSNVHWRYYDIYESAGSGGNCSRSQVDGHTAVQLDVDHGLVAGNTLSFTRFGGVLDPVYPVMSPLYSYPHPNCDDPNDIDYFWFTLDDKGTYEVEVTGTDRYEGTHSLLTFQVEDNQGGVLATGREENGRTFLRFVNESNRSKAFIRIQANPTSSGAVEAIADRLTPYVVTVRKINASCEWNNHMSEAFDCAVHPEEGEGVMSPDMILEADFFPNDFGYVDSDYYKLTGLEPHHQYQLEIKVHNPQTAPVNYDFDTLSGQLTLSVTNTCAPSTADWTNVSLIREQSGIYTFYVGALACDYVILHLRDNRVGSSAYQLSLRTLLEADAYEADDSRAMARALAFNSASQQHTIHVRDDEDWMELRLNRAATFDVILEHIAGYDVNQTTFVNALLNNTTVSTMTTSAPRGGRGNPRGGAGGVSAPSGTQPTDVPCSTTTQTSDSVILRCTAPTSGTYHLRVSPVAQVGGQSGTTAYRGYYSVRLER